MSTLFFNRRVTLDLPFFVLAAITWVLFFTFVECYSTPLNALIFAVGAGLLSSGMLKLMGYFDAHRLLPRKSDPFLVLFAIPCGAVIQLKLLRILFDVSICSTQTVLLWTPLLSLAIFGGHYFMSVLMLRGGRKKKVVLDVLPLERGPVLEAFEGLKMDRYLEFLSRQDLKEHLLRSAAKEIDLIIISRSAVSRFDAETVLIRAHLAGIPIVDHRHVVTDLSGRISLAETDLWSYLMGATPQTALLRAFSQVKVVLEPLLALLLGVLFAPIMVVLAALIKYTNPGPVFYRQVRTGHLGRNFLLVKFRSMRVDAEANGPQWAAQNDDRVTKIGKFMRRTRLDELPQLWNVIRGEMSFCGPRPERPEIYQSLKKEIPLFSMRTVVRPGITGWAQVCAGYAASVEESAKKLEYDLYYIQHMSPRLDLIILLKTLIVAVLGAEGAERQRSKAANSDTARSYA